MYNFVTWTLADFWSGQSQTPPPGDELLPGLAVLSLEETGLVFDDVTRFCVDVKGLAVCARGATDGT